MQELLLLLSLGFPHQIFALGCCAAAAAAAALLLLLLCCSCCSLIMSFARLAMQVGKFRRGRYAAGKRVGKGNCINEVRPCSSPPAPLLLLLSSCSSPPAPRGWWLHTQQCWLEQQDMG